MQAWFRLPDADAAGTNSNDTTEVQIGTGVKIPTWARSIRALHAHLIYLALTNDEPVSGYLRLNTDNNDLDPLNFPLPVVQALTGAIATHRVIPHELPISVNVTPNDTLRIYAGLDAATTGVHTIQGYLLFSSQSAPYHMHAEKSAITNASATANTASATVTINTLEGKCSQIIGGWHYAVGLAGITAAQTVGGYVKIKSKESGWLEQNIPTNILPSGLSTALEPITKPCFWGIDELLKEANGVHKFRWPDAYPMKGKGAFDFVNYMDGTNTDAPACRYGLIWKR